MNETRDIGDLAVGMGRQDFDGEVGVDIRDLLVYVDRFEDGTILADIDSDGDGVTGTPDGGVDINDLLFFLVGFEAGSTAVDLDNGSGQGTPDNAVDINDLLYFLVRFEAGC